MVVPLPGVDRDVGDATTQQWMVAEAGVADVEPRQRGAQIGVHLAEADEMSEDVVQLGDLIAQPEQRCLSADQVQSVGIGSVSLVVISVEQRVRGLAAHDGGELPAQVERVLHTHVHALPAGRKVDVCGIAGQ